jgi:hypothetical protein
MLCEHSSLRSVLAHMIFSKVTPGDTDDIRKELFI